MGWGSQIVGKLRLDWVVQDRTETIRELGIEVLAVMIEFAMGSK